MVRLRWEGNGSTRYDGKTQDVAVKFIIPEDRSKTAVAGNTVRVKWGRQSRVWRAVVVGQEGDGDAGPRKRAATPDGFVRTKRAKEDEEKEDKKIVIYYIVWSFRRPGHKFKKAYCCIIIIFLLFELV